MSITQTLKTRLAKHKSSYRGDVFIYNAQPGKHLEQCLNGAYAGMVNGNGYSRAEFTFQNIRVYLFKEDGPPNWQHFQQLMSMYSDMWTFDQPALPMWATMND
jgi:hypothetical protein